MPKKQPRNSFYFFMIDFKEEQRKKGIVYANMAEVSQAAGPAWTAAAPGLRAKYEALAKAEKAKNNVPERKFTSTGVSLAELEAAERERREAIQAEKEDIINFVKLKGVNECIMDEDIFLMDVNSYCKAGGAWLVGELALLRLSLRDGVKDTYHEIINPGMIPIGYALDVKLGSKELGLPMPDESTRRADYINILATIMDYMRGREETGGEKARGTRGSRPPLPPVYTLPDKVPQCFDFIQQLCSIAAADETQFRVYQLDTLFYQIVTNTPARNNEGFPKESLALAALKKDPFKYSQRLACSVHEEADKTVECALSRVKRWAYTVLDHTCALLDVRAVPGRHEPADYDLDAIQQYRDTRASHAPPPLDTSRELSSSASQAPSLNSTAELPSASTKRKHVPLRMPKADYSLMARTAPQLSDARVLDEQFPPLMSRGRGRGLAAIFDNMKM